MIAAFEHIVAAEGVADESIWRPRIELDRQASINAAMTGPGTSYPAIMNVSTEQTR
jgi:hypothetical protein